MSFPDAHRAVVMLLLGLSLSAGTCQGVDSSTAVEEGTRLYEMGDYEAALPLLEEGVAEGAEDGALFYRLAYLYSISSLPEQARFYREKALPLLTREIGSDKASLESFYYLTATHANLGNGPEMKSTAVAGVTRFAGEQKLSGADWFRLGRLYQFLGHTTQKEAAFAKSIEAFDRESDPSPILHALALVADGNSDFAARRYSDALQDFRKARGLHASAQVAPFQAALACLGAEEFAEAAENFSAVQEEEAKVEAQYGADVARRLGAAGGFLATLPDGEALRDLEGPALEAAVLKAAQALRGIVQDGESGLKVGEIRRKTEQLFFSLLAEQMLRGTAIREPSLSGGYADLIRRQ